jgi:hypothetical protein
MLSIKVRLNGYLKNERPTWCHLLFYFTSYVLNMYRTLIYPSSGACDYVVELPHRSSCSQFVVCWRFGAAGFGWCSFCRLNPVSLHLIPLLIQYDRRNITYLFVAQFSPPPLPIATPYAPVTQNTELHIYTIHLSQVVSAGSDIIRRNVSYLNIIFTVLCGFRNENEVRFGQITLLLNAVMFCYCLWVVSRERRTDQQTGRQTNRQADRPRDRNTFFLCFADRASQYIYLSN